VGECAVVGAGGVVCGWVDIDFGSCWVSAPLWGPVVLFLVCLVLFLIVCGIGILFVSKGKGKR
jgi:hypothetical protein